VVWDFYQSHKGATTSSPVVVRNADLLLVHYVVVHKALRGISMVKSGQGCAARLVAFHACTSRATHLQHLLDALGHDALLGTELLNVLQATATSVSMPVHVQPRTALGMAHIAKLTRSFAIARLDVSGMFVEVRRMITFSAKTSLLSWNTSNSFVRFSSSDSPRFGGCTVLAHNIRPCTAAETILVYSANASVDHVH